MGTMLLTGLRSESSRSFSRRKGAIGASPSQVLPPLRKAGRLAETRGWIPNVAGHLSDAGVQHVKGPAGLGRTRAFRLGPARCGANSSDDGVEVVDYKLSRGANLKHDLLQVAIYARLLREVKPGLKFSGVLEYYEPALHVVPVAVAELDGIFEEIVAPVLAELAARVEDVAAGVPPAGTTPRRESSAPPVGGKPAATSDPIALAIEKCFADFKLNVHLLGKQEGPQLIRYQVQPASGVRVVSLANRAEDLQVALRLKQPPLIQAAPGCVTIDIPKDQPDTVSWRDLPRDGPPLGFPIGVGIDNELLTADFADPNTCHALIAGTSGSGKSEFLKCLAASLIGRNSPRTLRLSLIDPKILTFGALTGSQHLLEPVITDMPAAIACLEAAVRRWRRATGNCQPPGWKTSHSSERMNGCRFV